MVGHAFFKALLFLGAGSVIHGLDDEQDLKRMGSLRRYMPLTFGTFVVGWLAIAGVPPLSGFWSKGDVLTNVFAQVPGAVGARPRHRGAHRLLHDAGCSSSPSPGRRALGQGRAATTRRTTRRTSRPG